LRGSAPLKKTTAATQGNHEGHRSNKSKTTEKQDIEGDNNRCTSKPTTAAKQGLEDEHRQKECTRKWKTSTIEKRTPAWNFMLIKGERNVEHRHHQAVTGVALIHQC